MLDGQGSVVAARFVVIFKLTESSFDRALTAFTKQLSEEPKNETENQKRNDFFMTPDNQLPIDVPDIQRAIAGDKDSTAKVYAYVIPRLVNWLRSKHPRSKNNAEDIAHDTFIVAFAESGLRECKSVQQVESFFRLVAYRKFIQETRTKTSQSPSLCNEPPNPNTEQDHEFRKLLIRTIRYLEPHLKDAVAHDTSQWLPEPFQDDPVLSKAEIKIKYGITTNETIRNWRAAARAIIRDTLEQAGYGHFFE